MNAIRPVIPEFSLNRDHLCPRCGTFGAVYGGLLCKHPDCQGYREELDTLRKKD